MGVKKAIQEVMKFGEYEGIDEACASGSGARVNLLVEL